MHHWGPTPLTPRALAGMAVDSERTASRWVEQEGDDDAANRRGCLGCGRDPGPGGGVLGAFVACTLGQAVAYRVLEQFSDQYIDLGPPALQAARPARDQDLPPVTAAARGARPRPAGTPALTAR